MTQKDLARKTGINASSISKYERGKVKLGSRNLQRACDATGYSSDQFIQDAWALSRGDSPRQIVESGPPAFPQSEIERIYEESAGNAKNLYVRTCRALFDALWKASRPR